MKSASKIGSSTILIAACTMRSRTTGIDSGLFSAVPGFWMNTRRAGNGRHTPIAKVVGQLIQEPVNPVFLNVGQGGRVDTRSAVVRAHRNPRPLQDVPAEDLVMQRVKPSSRIGLGRPVQRMLQGTNRVTHGPHRGGTSRNDGTHRIPLLTDTARERSSGPSLTGGYVVRSARSVLRPPPTPCPAPGPLPGSTPVIGPGRPRRRRALRPGRVSPVPAVTVHAFRDHYAGAVS